MKRETSGRARKVIWGAVAVLFVLHQDFWWWSDRGLVLGFLPVGLAYHAAFSIAAATLWALATRFAWPHHIEQWADAGDETTSAVARSGEASEGDAQ